MHLWSVIGLFLSQFLQQEVNLVFKELGSFIVFLHHRNLLFLLHIFDLNLSILQPCNDRLKFLGFIIIFLIYCCLFLKHQQADVLGKFVNWLESGSRALRV